MLHRAHSSFTLHYSNLMKHEKTVGKKINKKSHAFTINMTEHAKLLSKLKLKKQINSNIFSAYVLNQYWFAFTYPMAGD